MVRKNLEGGLRIRSSSTCVRGAEIATAASRSGGPLTGFEPVAAANSVAILAESSTRSMNRTERTSLCNETIQQ